MRLSKLSGLHVLAALSILIHTKAASQIEQHDQQPLQALEEGLSSEHSINTFPLEQIQGSELLPEEATFDDSISPRSIAIIGAGPAGSSAAYHLRKFSKVPLNITIFDSNPYIGGRTTTVNALNDPRYPVELGASIFVEINGILVNATRDFELPVDERIDGGTDAKYELGVWDGLDFVFYAGASSDDDDDDNGGSWKGKLAGWWDIAKLFWRYGLSPLRLRRLQQSVIGKFFAMYNEDENGPITFDLTAFVRDEELLGVTGKTGSKFLWESGVSDKFAREIVQASSRVNYAQNLYDFHGLETMVCMSTEGAMSIRGGNWQIFDRMVKYSGAEVLLNTTVTGLTTHDVGISQVSFKSSLPDDRDDEPGYIPPTEHRIFDRVIMAHPQAPSILDIAPPANPPFEEPEYVNLYVTLFTTPYRPHPDFFDLKDPSQIPNTILTTLPPDLDPSLLHRGPSSLGLTPFWSLSTIRALNPSTDSSSLIPDYLTSGHIPADSLALNTTQYLYKIFSPRPILAHHLVWLFGWDYDDLTGPITTGTKEEFPSLSALPKSHLTWHYTKLWQSYPYLPPRTTFEGWDVYAEEENEKYHGKVWRTDPMEVFISTMETMALSGRNVARLVLDEIEGRER